MEKKIIAHCGHSIVVGDEEYEEIKKFKLQGFEIRCDNFNCVKGEIVAVAASKKFLVCQKEEINEEKDF